MTQDKQTQADDKELMIRSLHEQRMDAMTREKNEEIARLEQKCEELGQINADLLVSTAEDFLRMKTERDKSFQEIARLREEIEALRDAIKGQFSNTPSLNLANAIRDAREMEAQNTPRDFIERKTR